MPTRTNALATAQTMMLAAPSWSPQEPIRLPVDHAVRHAPRAIRHGQRVA